MAPGLEGKVTLAIQVMHIRRADIAVVKHSYGVLNWVGTLSKTPSGTELGFTSIIPK